MGRPRYKVNPDDWSDTLDWLNNQLGQPEWLVNGDHPIHRFGIVALRECLVEWQMVSHPTEALCGSAQAILTEALHDDDWARLRKALSARRRRRRERRGDQKSVNITLSPIAHAHLVELKEISGFSTLSETLETALPEATKQAKSAKAKQLSAEILTRLKALKPIDQVLLIEKYLTKTQERRSLANACKIAYQLFRKRSDADSLKLLQERFVEDLVWNELHLSISYLTLDLF